MKIQPEPRFQKIRSGMEWIVERHVSFNSEVRGMIPPAQWAVKIEYDRARDDPTGELNPKKDVVDRVMRGQRRWASHTRFGETTAG